MPAVPSAGRRLLAFGLDYLVFAGYIAVLTRVGFAARRLVRRPIGSPTTERQRTRLHALGFVSLTLPVTLYFAAQEAASAGATLGKRALGLRVVTEHSGGRVSFGRALLRAGVKFLPWEIAHTALWHTPGWPANARPAARHWAGYGLALTLAGWYMGALFTGSRRPLSDRLAGTQVVLVR
ncbi:MAG: RDD family protein [Thermomicrobiales bacterium]